MQLFAIVASALTLASAVVAAPVELGTRGVTVQVTWDSLYDDPSGSLDTVACSNGANGLEPKYETFGALPNFPFIGGAQPVTGWDSINCGTCWQLRYNGTAINILAVDYAEDGFNIGKTAMNALTNGQAEQLGVVQVASSHIDTSLCGL